MFTQLDKWAVQKDKCQMHVHHVLKKEEMAIMWSRQVGIASMISWVLVFIVLTLTIQKLSQNSYPFMAMAFADSCGLFAWIHCSSMLF